MRNEAMTRDRESGVALLSAILVLMLMSALLVGFIAMVNADQSASGINRDQTQAYAAAHAGVEKLTADLGQLFQGNFAPTNNQVNALWQDAGDPPALPGISYLTPNGNPGYRITFTDTTPADGSPDIENFPTGSNITSGPYEGLVGLITPYTIEVTARTAGNAEVRMRREMQTVGIPVFQFGIFSENDLSFFAGPNFDFGGRVHSNQHLWLKQDERQYADAARPRHRGGRDRPRSARQRRELPQRVRPDGARGGLHADAAGGRSGSVPQPARHRRQRVGHGSRPRRSNRPGRTPRPAPTTTGSGTAGPVPARLSLPLVSDGATPIDIIRRPVVGEVADVVARPAALLQHGDAADPDLGSGRRPDRPAQRRRRADSTREPDAGLSGPGRAAVHDHGRRIRRRGWQPAGGQLQLRRVDGRRQQRLPDRQPDVVDRRLHPDQPAGQERHLDRRDQGDPATWASPGAACRRTTTTRRPTRASSTRPT